MDVPSEASTADIVRALDLVAQAYALAKQNDPQARAVMEQARNVEPTVWNEVRAGRLAGSVPRPGTKQWEDWLNRRTGTTQQARDRILGRDQTTKTKKRSNNRSKNTTNKTPAAERARPERQRRRDTHPMRRVAIGRFTHEQLAQRWAAVKGDAVSTRTLAELLNVPSTELRRYARDIEDLLGSDPWRVPVRAGSVNGYRLADRCEAIFDWVAPRG